MSDLAAQVRKLPHGLARGRLVALDVRGAERWDGSLADTLGSQLGTGEAPARAREGVLEAGAVARELQVILEQHGSPDSFRGLVTGADENPFVAKARRMLAEWSPAGAEGDAARVSPALTALLDIVGLGVGFTPSGDDFLAGALLSHALTADAEVGGGATADAAGEPAPPLDPQDSRVREALARTTAGGCTLLWLALHGRFPAYLLDLGRALAGSEADTLREAAGRAFGHGETSGMDSVSGLVWYLQHV
jgi:hypothetical protein